MDDIIKCHGMAQSMPHWMYFLYALGATAKTGGLLEECVNCNQLRIENSLLHNENRKLQTHIIACDGEFLFIY